MHIPEGVLSNAVCPVTLAGGAIIVSAAALSLKKSEKKVDANKFALVTAFIFALQMINYPVLQGISGHLIGGMLAAFFLGTAPAVLSISLVLLVQALVFQDGGVLALGANIITMAGISAGIGGVLIKKSEKSGGLRYLNYFLSASVVVFAAALVCGVFVSIGKDSPFEIMALMTKGHITAALLEAFITTAAIVFYEKGFFENKRYLVALLAIVVLAPFASSLPDGLTYVLGSFGVKEGASLISSPMPDYTLPLIKHELASVYLAAFIGVLATFIISRLGFKKIN